ncbi:hypothetical protein EJB05_08038, partial [Eragrostis curvula]
MTRAGSLRTVPRGLHLFTASQKGPAPPNASTQLLSASLSRCRTEHLHERLYKQSPARAVPSAAAVEERVHARGRRSSSTQPEATGRGESPVPAATATARPALARQRRAAEHGIRLRTGAAIRVRALQEEMQDKGAVLRGGIVTTKPRSQLHNTAPEFSCTVLQLCLIVFFIPPCRIRWRSMSTTVTSFLDTRSSWLSALSAIKNSMFSKTVRIVELVWVNTSVQNATSLTMTYRRTNSIATDVAYVGKTGGAENFYHCDKCGCCYTSVLRDSHRCVDRAMHHNCPVCFEYLFDSTKAISVLHCGHTIHLECLYEMRAHQQFSCPICLRSACDMSDAWQKLDQEVAASPMPAIYQKKMVRTLALQSRLSHLHRLLCQNAVLTTNVSVIFSTQIWILCNDCGKTSNVQFHILAHKCPGCSSYNTRQTRGDPAACSRI